MRFKIVVNGKVIAAFVNASDRDLCLGILQEEYGDFVFEARDE